MILLSSVIDTFKSEFMAQYQQLLLPSHLKALGAMQACRTSHSLMMQAKCTNTDCNHQILIPHSCGHRNCPHCQHHESQQWLERQLKKQVPAEHFLLTFTLPKELRPLAWTHQRTLYKLIIRCSWETIQRFSRNDKQLQGKPGAISVLHTHSRRLDYHPHVHVVMPAAAIDEERVWRKKSDYLFNHKALATVFRAKMLDAIQQEGLTMPSSYPKTWVVDVKSVGSGEKALIYLGRYLYKGVIQERDIVSCKNGEVTFRYQNSKTKKTEYRTESGIKFLWLVLQHILPKGFRRARNFGFLHSNSKRLIALIQYKFGFDPSRALAWIRKRPEIICPRCGAVMEIVRTRIALDPALRALKTLMRQRKG